MTRVVQNLLMLQIIAQRVKKRNKINTKGLERTDNTIYVGFFCSTLSANLNYIDNGKKEKCVGSNFCLTMISSKERIQKRFLLFVSILSILL